MAKLIKKKHIIRDVSGRFRKVEANKTRKDTNIKMLHKGFKKWNAKRNQYDKISKENKPEQNE